MRKLASIQKIVRIEPIEGADKIVKATVLGWSCVTQKSNNFQPGDWVVYFEPDSVIPTKGVFEFLKKKPEDTTARLKTIRLRGQVSQGLILPLKEVLNELRIVEHPEIPGLEFAVGISAEGTDTSVELEEGADLTEVLGITKYEPEVPAQLRGLVKGAFPHFISKTDETRIQSCPGVLTRHEGKKFYITEKIDGSSFTCFFLHNQETANNLHVKPEDLKEDGTVFGVCSRNMYLTETVGNSFWATARKYDVEQKLRNLGRSLCIQGEMYGNGIQKNKLKLPSVYLAVFNIKDLTEDRYLNLSEMEALCKELDLPMVPILEREFVLGHNVEQMVNIAIRRSTLTPEVWAEGIVVRPLNEENDKDLGRLSFKVINPEFLLKYDE